MNIYYKSTIIATICAHKREECPEDCLGNCEFIIEAHEIEFAAGTVAGHFYF